jgi:hypothetical protein
MQGAALRQDLWFRLTNSQTDGSIVMPILVHSLDDHGNSPLGVQEDLDQVLA